MCASVPSENRMTSTVGENVPPRTRERAVTGVTAGAGTSAGAAGTANGRRNNDVGTGDASSRVVMQ